MAAKTLGLLGSTRVDAAAKALFPDCHTAPRSGDVVLPSCGARPRPNSSVAAAVAAAGARGSTGDAVLDTHEWSSAAGLREAGKGSASYCDWAALAAATSSDRLLTVALSAGGNVTGFLVLALGCVEEARQPRTASRAASRTFRPRSDARCPSFHQGAPSSPSPLWMDDAPAGGGSASFAASLPAHSPMPSGPLRELCALLGSALAMQRMAESLAAGCERALAAAGVAPAGASPPVVLRPPSASSSSAARGALSRTLSTVRANGDGPLSPPARSLAARAASAGNGPASPPPLASASLSSSTSSLASPAVRSLSTRSEPEAPGASLAASLCVSCASLHTSHRTRHALHLTRFLSNSAPFGHPRAAAR